jgi:hypothetical protein
MTARRLARNNALRIAGLYCILRFTWIIVSDRLVGAPAVDTLKSLGFVLASGLVIYVLLARELRRHHERDLELEKAPVDTVVGKGSVRFPPRIVVDTTVLP